jgi:hypothetical protein
MVVWVVVAGGRQWWLASGRRWSPVVTGGPGGDLDSGRRWLLVVVWMAHELVVADVVAGWWSLDDHWRSCGGLGGGHR